MTNSEKEHSILGTIKEVLGYASRILVASVVPVITEGTEVVMQTIDDRIVRIEKRIMRKLIGIGVIVFGATFLIFALFFFLREYVGWNNTTAFFSIGITIFVIGLMLEARRLQRRTTW